MKKDIIKGCCIGVISALIYCICNVTMYGYFTSKGLFSDAGMWDSRLMGLELIIYIICVIFSFRKQNNIKYSSIEISYGVTGIILFNVLGIWSYKEGFIKEMYGFFPGFQLGFILALNNFVFAFMIFLSVFIMGFRMVINRKYKVGVTVLLGAFILLPLLYNVIVFIDSIWNVVRSVSF